MSAGLRLDLSGPTALRLPGERSGETGLSGEFPPRDSLPLAAGSDRGPELRDRTRHRSGEARLGLPARASPDLPIRCGAGPLLPDRVLRSRTLSSRACAREARSRSGTELWSLLPPFHSQANCIEDRGRPSVTT